MLAVLPNGRVRVVASCYRPYSCVHAVAMDSDCWECANAAYACRVQATGTHYANWQSQYGQLRCVPQGSIWHCMHGIHIVKPCDDCQNADKTCPIQLPHAEDLPRITLCAVEPFRIVRGVELQEKLNSVIQECPYNIGRAMHQLWEAANDGTVPIKYLARAQAYIQNEIARICKARKVIKVGEDQTGTTEC